ncbi:MAG: Hint domain-containing protein [Pseudomonadota bacterium]
MVESPTTVPSIKSFPVLPAHAFRVIGGANEGDYLSVSDDMMLDDVYVLPTETSPISLSLCLMAERITVAQDSELGTTGARVHIDCAIMLMADGVNVTEALVFAEVDDSDHLTQVYLLPLAPLRPKCHYRLVGITRDGLDKKLAHLSCVSLTRGTRISLSTGRQVAVEDLSVGDLILTRDDGAQPLRWIGQMTQRASGAFAPIRIAAGALNNLDDLVVSPDHRLFIYQRSDRIGAGRPELLIRARHLENGSTVTVETGGFVDYFQLLFDTHQIVFAEGIATESMQVDGTTVSLLDGSLYDEFSRQPLGAREIDGLDVQRALLDRPDVVSLLRHATKG